MLKVAALPVLVASLAFFGCAAPEEEDDLVPDTEEVAEAFSTSGDPSSKYDHKPLAKGQELYLQGSRDTNKISPSDVSQGGLNDCWVMSALISIARTNPAAIERMIRPRSDGNYDVTLYVGSETTDDSGVKHRAPKVFNVAPTFATNDEGELVYAKPQDVTREGAGEIWPLLIEKAYAQYFGKYTGPIAVLGRHLEGNDKPAFRALLPTGSMDTYQVNRQDDDRVIEVLAGAFRDGRPVTGLVMIPNGSVAKEWKIETWHHYSIAAVDPVKRTIDLEDPVRKRTGAKGLPVRAFRQTFSYYSLGPVAR